MKILVHIALLFFIVPLPFSSAAAPPSATQQIALAADHTFRGPTNAALTLAAGETAVTLTPAQYAALNALRLANPAATKFTFDGANFALHPIAQLGAQLLAIYNGLTPGEQLLFAPQMSGVKTLLAAGNVTEARLIIALSGTGMPTDIANARTAMLAAIDALFPPAP